MSTAAPARASRLRPRIPRLRLDWISACFVLASLSIPLSVFYIGGRAVTPQASGQPAAVAASPRLPSAVQVLAMTRQLKLITVQVDARAAATSIDDRWRGTAAATVVAPVRYSYGVDLAKLDEGALRYGYLTQSYTLTLPEPTLLAVEVDGAHPVREDVRVTGTRFRSMSGQQQLVAAHKAVHESARQPALSKEQYAQIRQETLEQTHRMVAAMVGPWGRVEVRYAER